MINKMKYWFWNWMAAISQFLNAFGYPLWNMFTPLKNFGDKDETLSGVMGKNIRADKCRLCKFICFFLRKLDYKHCIKSIEDDENVDRAGML